MYQLSDIFTRLSEYEYLVMRRTSAFFCAALAADASTARFEDNIIYVLAASELRFDAVCSGNACLFVIGDSNRELAELCASIVLFDAMTDAEALLRDLRRILQESMRLDSAEKEMIDAIQKPDSMERLINIAHNYLGNPLLIRDMAFRTLIVRERENILSIKGNMLQAITPEGYTHPAFVADPEVSYRQQLIRKARHPLMFGVPEARRIMGEIYIGETPVAHLIVYEQHHLFREADLEFANIFVKMLSVEFQKSARFHAANAPYEAFLNDVLDGKMEEKSIQELAAGFKWQLRKFYCIAVLSLRFSDEQDSIRSYSRQAIYNSVIGDLSKNFPSMRGTHYNGNSVLFFNLPSLSAVRKMNDKMSLLVANSAIQIGMSDVFTEMFRAGNYYTQAKAVLEFGQKIAPEKSLYLFEHFYFDFLFSKLSANCLRQFCIRQAWTALHYDQKNMTTLCESMLVYLQEGQSNIAAAKLLDVHRNTVSYRINKFCEITELDLRDGDITARLYISLLILQQLKAFPLHHARLPMPAEQS